MHVKHLTAQLGQINLCDAVAKSLGISQSCLRNWLARTDIDDRKRDGSTSGELAELRRKARRLELENEVLRKAATHFARMGPPTAKWCADRFPGAAGAETTRPLTNGHCVLAPSKLGWVSAVVSP